MPCVFPVLSLKALSLARETTPHERHVHASAYLFGVLLSFTVFAVGLIILRTGGEEIGWGTQFQSPAFVLILMALFMALGLNMSGVFEIGGRLAGVGDRFTHIPGFTGYFSTGVLATIVATPCTAPFMGTAVGYAFSQPSNLRLLAVLLVLGIGFALPMVALSYFPAIGRALPKPGPWMTTLKGVLAFPLYATAGWLLWVLSIQLGSEGVLGSLVVLLGIAFAAWLAGLTHEPHPLRSGSAVVVALAAIWGGLLLLPASSNKTANANASPAPFEQTSSGLSYEPFSNAKLAALRAANKPVFINLTAAWCITCKVNEQVALSSSLIAEAFEARGIVPLKGDWSKANPEITAMLQKFGRAGVPLYLLYPADGGEPAVLPQILTESIVLDGLAKISPEQQAKGE
jgi:thiol:disulfide interchange protein DsbD